MYGKKVAVGEYITVDGGNCVQGIINKTWVGEDFDILANKVWSTL